VRRKYLRNFFHIKAMLAEFFFYKLIRRGRVRAKMTRREGMETGRRGGRPVAVHFGCFGVWRQAHIGKRAECRAGGERIKREKVAREQ
jgi:hypothetical protein